MASPPQGQRAKGKRPGRQPLDMKKVDAPITLIEMETAPAKAARQLGLGQSTIDREMRRLGSATLAHRPVSLPDLTIADDNALCTIKGCLGFLTVLVIEIGLGRLSRERHSGRNEGWTSCPISPLCACARGIHGSPISALNLRHTLCCVRFSAEYRLSSRQRLACEGPLISPIASAARTRRSGRLEPAPGR